jgi:cytoskeletal protein RodZ
VADIGSTLREARMRARIDITEVETRTKIRAKYLRAIENEEWDLLPGPVYVKSFLRTYGDYLGLDSRRLVDDYKRRYERLSDHELRPIAALSRDRERAARGPLLPPWAIIGAVILALVVILWFVGNANKPASTNAGTTAAPRHTARGHKHSAPVKPAARVLPANATLSLVPTGQVYICLIDGTGRKLTPAVVYAAGQRIKQFKAPKMLLTLGNASIHVTIDSRPVTVPPSANAIRYLIGPGPPFYRRIPVASKPSCV